MSPPRAKMFKLRRALLPLCCVLLAAALGGRIAARHAARNRTAEDRSAAGLARSCPGAHRCPYESVSVIGRRGEGVLRFPEALAVASHGDVYVGDQYGYVVQRFSPHGRPLGQWGSRGAGPGQLGAVGGLAVSGAGDVYVVDSEHDRVEEFTGSGRFVRTWGSLGSRIGQFNFGAGGLGAPPGGGIAVAGGYVYVSDTHNNRIERFTLEGADPYVMGSPGHGPGELAGPHGVYASGTALYVSDFGNNRISVFHTNGPFARAVGSFGGGVGQFSGPFGVAVGLGGDVYVADDNNHRVVELNSSLGYAASQRLQPVQGPGEGFHPNFGNEEVSYPRTVAVGPDSRVYVADAAANKIDVLTPNGQLIATWGTSGRAYGQFILPRGVAATAEGGALVADTLGGRVEVFNQHLSYRTSHYSGEAILGHHLFKPVAVARASDGTMWVTDQQNDLVRHLGHQGELLGTLGGDGASRAARLNEPSGVAVGAHGDVFVADTGENLVKRYSPSGKPLSRFGGSGSAPGRLHRPVAIALSPSGDIYVVDTGNDRVQELTATGSYVRAWSGGSGRGSGASWRLRAPDGIAVDAHGSVFVADAGSDRILEFTGDGRLQHAWGAPGGLPGELNGPGAVAVTCKGGLLVADTYNNRVQLFSGVAAKSACATHEAP